jgi:hypothetical protein
MKKSEVISSRLSVDTFNSTCPRIDCRSFVSAGKDYSVGTAKIHLST